MGLFLGIDELGRNSYSIADAQNRTFDDRVYLKFAGDLAQWFPSALVKHSGGTSNHAQLTNLGKCGDERLRQPVRKILLLRITRQILQWQNHERMESWCLPLNPSNEPIAPPRKSFDIAGRIGSIPQRF